MNDLDAFARLVQALDPWRGQLVFIGGWSHRLHTLHPQANPLGFQPVFTKDTDLAFHHQVPLEGDIKAALVRQGFEEQLSGDTRPPVAHYTLGNEADGFYAEFLTPLAGSGYKRNGQTDATLLAGGISAQKIRHLDVLLTAPWVMPVGPAQGVPLPAPVDLRVAHPVCFMVQKFLIKKQRTPDKHRQDLLYVFDTVQLFGHLLEQFATDWQSVIAPSLDPGARHTVVQECAASFDTLTDAIRDAARIPQDRQLDPEELRATCRYALGQILAF